MMRGLILGIALVLGASNAQAAEAIVGNWKTASGATAQIAPCGGSFCVTMKSGKYAGKTIGKMAGTDGSYKGTITDPQGDKTYSGTGTVNGNSLKMKGCMLSVLCKTQTWTRL